MKLWPWLKTTEESVWGTFPLEKHIVIYRNQDGERFEIEMIETGGHYCNGTRKGRKTKIWEIKREFKESFPHYTFVGAHMNIKENANG